MMGMTDVGAIGTRIFAKNVLLWEVPEHWSLEDAVTIPIVYTTIIYGLRIVSILITIHPFFNVKIYVKFFSQIMMYRTLFFLTKI